MDKQTAEQEANDFFTCHPRYRTKERLKEYILQAEQRGRIEGMKEKDELWRKRFASNSDYQNGYDRAVDDCTELIKKLAWSEDGVVKDLIDAYEEIKKLKSNKEE